MKAAMSGVKAEPAATMAVPSPSPSGISPAGLLENNSSSWAWLIFRSWGTSYAMVGLLWCDGYRGVGEYDLRRLLTDHVHRARDEEPGNAREHRGVDHAQALCSVDAEV